MTVWTEQELNRIGNAEELQIASRRKDGTMRRYVTIWVVRAGQDIYVRSAYGKDNPWFVRALASGEGRIRAAASNVTSRSSGPRRTCTPRSTAASGAWPHRSGTW
ncbi:DUF2255 family protein [Georgenia sp. SUBG003]|uniref:DUF2255 family protein n=1 Tax=Georgenia sp. SUBG003 TaxID=1497974 RepID=UPI003AB8EDC0